MCPQFLIKIGEKQYQVELDDLPQELRSQIQTQFTTKLRFQLRGREFQAELLDVAGIVSIPVSGISPISPMAPPSPASPPMPEIKEGHRILAPMAGVIKRILVELKQHVSRNQVLLILESMKMENEIRSDREGQVLQILVKIGDSVRENQPLMVIG